MAETSDNVSILNKTYTKDSWTNIPSHLIPKTGRRLHLDESHPIGIIRTIIEQHFHEYDSINNLSPVVTTFQNFDSLGFPPDHPGRSVSDSYYINKDIMLRTHTSAHQMETYATGRDAFLISADVYRRDEIDASHYPIFHQMEGAKLFKRTSTLSKQLDEDIASGGDKSASIKTLDDTILHAGNPRQEVHSIDEAEGATRHLKFVLNGLVQKLFGGGHEPLQVRWIDAYFPFTSPSWELEIFYGGEWLEVLGCGVIKQEILNKAGQSDKMGWAFGLGLERLAMVLFGIPDIRLFWSTDQRFLSQFQKGKISQFKPYSKYPPCYKDMTFWTDSNTNQAGGKGVVTFHENDFCEIVRNVAGDLVEDVKMIDEFVHPKTNRKSLCYRINYRSMDRSLTNDEINDLQEQVRKTVVASLGVELR